MNEGAFFQDMAMMMTVAGLVAVVFGRLKWPKVLGYIGAGIVLSEHTWGGSFLVSPQTISTIAQLGIVFLMFGMGLSFSLRDLKRIKGVVLPCAVVDTLVMVWLGYTLGVRVFGWGPVPSLFLGVAICDSATTLLAKVIDEMRWGDRPFAKFVLGTSVCEDIICVGAIAVATGFANGGGVSLAAMGKSLGGLFVFFLAVLVFGLIHFPRLLVSVNKQRDDESLTLTVLGGCFLVSWIAYWFEFSLALGAFLVGFLASNSDVKPRVEPIVEPLKAMFSAMFFISIGLLVDPRACWANAPAILLVSAAVIGAKLFNNTAVSLFVGLDVKTSVQNGFGLAQIGEFAFMTAILYMGIVEDADNPMFQIAVGASLLTTLLNPAMIRLSDRVGDAAEARMPERFRRGLESYRGWLAKLGSSKDKPAFFVLRRSLLELGVYAVLVFAVFTLLQCCALFDFSRFSTYLEEHDAGLFFLLANLFAVAMMPLIYATARRAGTSVGDMLFEKGGESWTRPVHQFVVFVIISALLVLYAIGVLALDISLLPNTELECCIVIGVLVVAAIFGWRRFRHAGERATTRLREALASESRRAQLGEMMTVQIPEGAFRQLAIAAGSPAVGATVVTLNIRAKTGATVVAVMRAGATIRNVGPDLEFQVGDTLVVTGSGPQIAALKDLLGIVSESPS